MPDADVCEGLQLLAGVEHAAGVRGIVDDDDLCLFRDGGLELFGGYFETLLVGGGHDDGDAAEHGDHLAVAEPERRGDDDLVADVHERGEGQEHVVLGAAGDDDLRVVVIEAAVELKPRDGHGQQRQQQRRIPVAR